VLLVREATRSEISLAVAMRLTKNHEVVEKDVAKAKVKGNPEANLQVQKTAMPLQLRP
jgi:hypothetical protein